MDLLNRFVNYKFKNIPIALRKYFFILIVCFSLRGIHAQHISFCKAYTESGEPIDLIYSREVPLAQSICILFDPGRKNISDNPVFLFIDRVSGNGKQNQFNKVFPAQPGRKWIAQSFKFIKDGKFDIYFTDSERNRLAGSTITVLSSSGIPEQPVQSINKYKDTDIIICERIFDGQPVNIKKNISIKLDNGMAYFFIKNNFPLNASRILARIFKKSKYAFDYDEFVAYKKYQIDPEWMDAFFKFKFEKTGEYKINVYDEKDLLIKTAYITVVN